MKKRRFMRRSFPIALALVIGLHSISVFANEDFAQTNSLMDVPVLYQPAENVQVDIPVVFAEDAEAADMPAPMVSEEAAEPLAAVEVKDTVAGEEDEVVTVSAAQNEETVEALKAAEDYEYELCDNSYVVISKYNGSDAEVVIPAELDGYPVKEIGAQAFYRCATITGVEIPASVVKIGGYAFADCTNLTEVKLPDSITELGSGVFSNCTALSQVNYPKSLEKAELHIFNGCTNLKSMEVPEGVTALPESLFYNANYLEEVKLPNSLLKIGEFAFFGCSKLKTIEIPASVTEIGRSAFYGCGSLTAIEIPSGVTTIGGQTFYKCTKLSSVSLPSSITTIGGYAFSYCTSLTEIELPDSVTKLDNQVFGYCTALSKVNYPKNLTEAGSSVFIDCTALKRIVVPEGVTVLADFVFKDACSLEEVILPESLQKIGNFAFQSCNSLKSIELPSGVTEISRGAFDGCDKLTKIEIPSKVTTIAYKTFSGCDGLTEVILPQGLTTIENEAFRNAVSLKTLWAPDSVKKIGNTSFQNCSNLIIQCPANSYIAIYAAENNILYETYASTYIGEADDILDRSGTYFYADTESKVYTGYVLFVVDYKLNENSESCNNKNVQILVPRNSVLQENTLKQDGVLCRNFTYEASVLTIPISESEGKIEFYVEFKVVPTSKEAIASYAKLIYSDKENQDKSEIIGILQEDIVKLTISCDDIIGRSTFTVNGIGPKESTVSLYLDDTKVGDVQTSKTGKYSKTITLTNPQENKSYVVKAESTVNGETYSAMKKVTYSSSYMPELKELKLYYNNHNDLAVDLLDLSATQYISFIPSVPYTFTADFANDDQISKVYIVSTRNNEKKYMEAVYNEREGIYVASGYFDESNYNYVPGTISVDYTCEKEVVKISETLNLNTTNITEGIKKTTVEKVDTGNANEEKYVFDITESLKESGKEFGKTLLEMVTSTYDSVNDMSSGDALELQDAISAGAGYFIPDENGNNWFAKADWTDDNTYTLFVKDVSGKSDKVVKFVISVKSSDALITLEDIAPCLADVGGLRFLHDVNEDGDENCALREQILMSAEITDKNAALKLEEQLFMVQCAMTVVRTMVPLLDVEDVSVSVAIGVTAVCGVEKAVSDVFWNLRVAEIMGMPICVRWIIDPSGYVYESVTANRISGVKVTAYYKESLSDESATLWDAGEYDQRNPLITDRDGKYAWDVPEGYWQVKYEKEGYETTYSEWLPVPPPQTEVNIRMAPTADLTVNTVNVYADHAEVVFSHYVIPDTVSGVKIKDAEGNEVSYTLQYDTTETDIAGTVYARRYQLQYQGKEAAHGEKLTVYVPQTTLSADNKPCKETTLSGICRKPLSVTVEEQITVAMGESVKIPVTFENYKEGDNLTAVSQYGYILFVNSTVQPDKDGKAYVAVKGQLFGSSDVFIYCDDKLLETIQVTVSGEATGYSISYVLNGGIQNQDNPQNYRSTDGDILLKAPTREGYTFEGWYSDEEFTAQVEKILGGSKKDYVFYAKWTPQTYTLTYDVNGGKNLENTTLKLNYDSTYGVLPTPEREGYTFTGWYTAKENGEEVTADTICKGDATIYAGWEKIQESVLEVFSDIPEKAWFVKAVQYVYDNDIMAGGGEKFSPNDGITREQFVQVLYNNSGKPAVDFEYNFPDVKNAWYKNAVLWAKEMGIANGKGNGEFGVNEKISRQDLALMLYKYARLNNMDMTLNQGEIQKYADADKVADYAKEALDWAVTQGIMSGKGNKGEDIATYRLDPKGTATRAECASMMMKLLEKQ